MAAVGAAGCNQAPQEEILPYVNRPPEVVPGVPRFYATSTVRGGYGFGLLAETHTGRPTKLEGHPEHPASLGGTLPVEQAEVLNLYDPDRARATWHRHVIGSISAFRRALHEGSNPLVPRHGKGMHLLLDPTTSPLIESLLTLIERRFPEAHIHFDPARAPVSRWTAARRALGGTQETHFDLTKADVVVDFSANFLGAMPMSVRWAHDFAEGREVHSPHGELNRLYSVETTMTITGASADHRLPVRPSDVGRVATGLLHAIAESRETVPASVRHAARAVHEKLPEHERHWADRLARDLLQRPGRSALIVGDRQPVAVHVIAHALNTALGNVGHAVHFTPSPMLRADQPEAHSLELLLGALDHDAVATLFILDGNPSYSLPEDAEFSARFAKAKRRVYLSPYENETAKDATWFVPKTHFLESWGDTRAYDGTVSFRQPAIYPLFGGKSAEELLAHIAGHESPDGRLLLRQRWSNQLGGEQAFAQALSRGLLPDSNLAPSRSELDWAAVEEAIDEIHRKDSSGLELDILPDPRLEDGRFANNAWLQETPEPVTKLVWDNAALVSPKMAAKHDLKKGDVVELRKGDKTVLAPVLPLAGQAEQTVTMWLGYGRDGAESVALGAGVDVAPLRSQKSPWLTEGVRMKKTSERYELVTTQDTFDMLDRDIAIHQSLEYWKEHPHSFQHHETSPPTLLPDRLESAPQWGMAIDLNRCTGCSACVTACIAENNIPIVGKDMVAMGREMLWMRIDTYHSSAGHRHGVLMQPMLCQHCEKAPCEYVCPVNATVHSDDGLNEMIYNRCVGTRFCSNNCPYKVRRFNWYDFNQHHQEPKPMVFNPDVTVRARGVMEKCTFCVQRIRRAQTDAKIEQRPLRDGNVTTACAQACPSKAIVFGLLSDEKSKISEKARSRRAYGCLSELGTRPRVRYLGRVSNYAKEKKQ